MREEGWDSRKTLFLLGRVPPKIKVVGGLIREKLIQFDSKLSFTIGKKGKDKERKMILIFTLSATDMQFATNSKSTTQ